jgi:hypothetical protein
MDKTVRGVLRLRQRWSLVDMLKTELDLPENNPTMLGLFKLEKINI